MIKTNDLKKGDRVQLRNGWYATIFDNMRGNRRMAQVEGFVTEIGSVYSHDILLKVDKNNNIVSKIEHTPAQLKLKLLLASS